MVGEYRQEMKETKTMLEKRMDDHETDMGKRLDELTRLIHKIDINVAKLQPK